MTTRKERETELLALIQHRRAKLAQLYRATLGLDAKQPIPADKPPAAMIMEILDREYPDPVPDLV